MSYKIFKSTTASMYDVSSSSNIDIKPTGLDFIVLSISDYAEPGEDFTITLSENEPLLTYLNQLYTIRDKFNENSYNITPFFVTGADREFGKITYTCTKVYKGYLIVPGIFEGEIL